MTPNGPARALDNIVFQRLATDYRDSVGKIVADIQAEIEATIAREGLDDSESQRLRERDIKSSLTTRLAALIKDGAPLGAATGMFQDRSTENVYGDLLSCGLLEVRFENVALAIIESNDQLQYWIRPN